jgi:hypothetical protein
MRSLRPDKRADYSSTLYHYKLELKTLSDLIRCINIKRDHIDNQEHSCHSKANRGPETISIITTLSPHRRLSIQINCQFKMFIPNLAFTPTLVSANILNPLPIRAATLDRSFQPVMDFDKDSCYNTAAVDANGKTNQGLDPADASTTQCRSETQLYHSNAYSRHMCNRGWCAIIYAYYFEMDSVDLIFTNKGHRHDWEHVVVWLKSNSVTHVATSAHGEFNIHEVSDVRFQGLQPKIVYHMDWKRTRNMRLAEKSDDTIENALGKWFSSPLVDWSGYPSSNVRDQLINHDFGDARMQFSDGDIGGILAKSMPDEASSDGFDCAFDDGSQS